ncbi:MAG: 50S ribosomal protein L21, partial [Chloroflexi bacterium]|nr:50S ribosomal protein L21 [Chloroflexota bacterium]
MSDMYAIVETGGKQYRVQPGQIVDVERLPVAAGETVALDRVLMVVEGEGKAIVGHPTVPGAQVMAEVLGEKKGEK